jgi:nicotinamidase-related amidase
MLMNAKQSCLLIVDAQERLMPAVHNGQRVIETSAWLMQIADRLGIPVLLSEQYPRGLGHTVQTLAKLAPPGAVMDKVHFSCAAEPACLARIEASGREQIILTGAEAHVCVLQTALGLRAAGKEVFVVADGIGSRDPSNVGLALRRMEAAGAGTVSREMVAFEWLERAGTGVFREISKQYLR